MLDVSDFEDVFLRAYARFKTFEDDFMSRFTQPIGIQAIRAMMSTMSEEQKAVMRRANPEAYDYVMGIIGGNDDATIS